MQRLEDFAANGMSFGVFAVSYVVLAAMLYTMF